jgi:hypothetical protein
MVTLLCSGFTCNTEVTLDLFHPAHFRAYCAMQENKAVTTKGRWTSTDAMRPTQCSVGYLEVALKVQELRERAQKSGDLDRYLKSHPIPAVLGPDSRMYLTDHHHMGLALVQLSNEWDAGDNPALLNPFRFCSFQVIKDLSDRHDLSMKQFFVKLEEHHLSHPFDGQGKRVQALPKYLSDLVDDPYRSLAGLARKAGAYDKVDAAFTEFQWADYLRDKVDIQLICKTHLAQAIHQAVLLANAPGASGLPGYHGGKPEAKLPTLVEIQERLTKRYGADDASPDLPPVG